MDPVLAGVLAGAAFPILIKTIDWLLARSGRQLAGRKDMREEVSALWARVGELEKQLEHWQERYRRLEQDYDELLRRYNTLLIEVRAGQEAK